MRECGDVEIEHGLNARPIAGVKFPMIPEAGVVDEEIDLEFFSSEPVGQGQAAVGSGEVGHKNANIEVRVKTAEVTGEFFQPVFAAGHKH